MKKLTAATITDEQVRELRAAPSLVVDIEKFSLEATCQIALGESEIRHAARARCAEIWNARHAKEST